MSTEPNVRLLRRQVAVAAVPVLDADQQRVVDHPGGPLLVLAGPGTGKTTTLVEAMVNRVEQRGIKPEQMLALTFSRKAAEQLRDRVTARLGRTTSATLASTFHSFAYGLVRRFAPAELYDAPLRLLSAAEQDVMLQDLLTGEQAVSWPPELAQAVGTRGFAREVQAVMSRAREKGLDPVDLVMMAREAEEPAFTAAGLFLQRYLDVLDWTGSIDYPDLIRRAVSFADAHRAQLRAEFTDIFVDEYQDTDPSQVELLRVLAGDGRNLTVVGDPHQSIYAFRGAEVRGILDFPQQFPTSSGERAPVAVLRTTRRFGASLLSASQQIAAKLPLTGSIPTEQRVAFLSPSAQSQAPEGSLDVLTFDTDRAEVEHIADHLRRAHLQEGIDWSQMAVLVRSGRNSIPALRRALGAAGVPVEVSADDTPLVREPAVAPLLSALTAVVDPDRLDPAGAQALLLSPLGGLDATELRGLARALRAQDATAAAAAGASRASSPALVRAALLDPSVLRTGFDNEAHSPGAATPWKASKRATQRARRLAALLHDARALLEAGASVEEVLWKLWSGTAWPERLRATALSGGPGARLAHRDLDAICALFELAARAEEQRGHTSVAAFLDTLTAQQIPADTLADRGVRGSAVRLLTAHRAKGLEWDLVVVAQVQEGVWPDLRRRGALLPADRIGADGWQAPTSARELLAEERRLFYVACTRARRRLVVTAVASEDDDGAQPSRFLAELPQPSSHRQGRPRRPLSLEAMVAELRRVLTDETAEHDLREAAAQRLARLSQITLAGRQIAPAADPATWWGTRALSWADRSVRPPDQPISLRASALESLLTCSLKWFAEREAAANSVSTANQGFGLIVHALAHRMAVGDVPDDRLDDLLTHVDRVWGSLSFRTPWSSEREHQQIELALDRLLRWHADPSRGRVLLATEQELAATVPVPGGEEVELRGRVDRLERDADGNVIVIDLKTGKSSPTVAQVQQHDQLGFYQHVINHGAADQVAGEPVRSGGAELVQLRTEPGAAAKVQHQDRLNRGDDGSLWIEERLREAVRRLREEDFSASPGDHCRYCDFSAMCPAKVSGTVLS